VGPSPYRGHVDTCVACGAELGVGRFCLNCGHRIGAPPPAREPAAAPGPPAGPLTDTAPGPDAANDVPASTTDAAPRPAVVVPPVQAADPTPVPPTAATSPPASPPASPSASPSDVVPDEHAAVATRRAAWDPREDLLPYEEVDDLDSDLPVSGKAWIGWVVGAALLLGVTFLLLQLLDTDGDEVATDPANGTTSSAEAPNADASDGGASDDGEGAQAPAGKARELARRATFEVPGTAPPTTDFDGNLAAYEASQMGDGNPATAWRMAGDATGETITVTLPEPGVVTRVGLVNGYAKQVAGVNWYPNNRRTVAVTWGFDDGSSVEQTFAERPGMQRLTVPPVETATVTITFTAVTPPGLGSLGRDYTAISEVSITGRPAG
jgi:hypothetical protein